MLHIVFHARRQRRTKGKRGMSTFDRRYNCTRQQTSISIQSGPKVGAKIVKQSIKKSLEISMVLFVALVVDLGPFLMPKWRQIGTKVEANTAGNWKGDNCLKCSQWSTRMTFGLRLGNQKRSNIDEKTEPMSKCVSTSIFHWSELYPILPKKPIKPEKMSFLENTFLPPVF